MYVQGARNDALAIQKRGMNGRGLKRVRERASSEEHEMTPEVKTWGN